MRMAGDAGRIGAILEGEAAAGRSSAELLGRFAATRDESAFAALVARHGPMVLATCRRILPGGAEADDAFQATFLVLARRAGSVGDPDRLAPWLHGVARRVAGRARAVADRRRRAEGRAGRPEHATEAGPPAEGFELRSVLDEELARLPAKYRAPLVLCYLDGLTSDEAARQLAWPVGTVRSRLAGGRDRLRSRLARRGYAPALLPPATLPPSAVPPALQAAAVRLALAPAAGPLLAGSAAALAQGALTSMTLAKIQATALAGLAVAALAAGVGARAAATVPADFFDQPAAVVPAPAPAGPAVAAQQPAGSGPTPAAAPDDSSAAMPPDPANYGRAVDRLQALEAGLSAVRRSIEPVRMVPKDGGLAAERPVPESNVLAIDRLQALEAELTSVRESIEPVPLVPKGGGFVPARVEPGRPVPFLVKQPAPAAAPPADDTDRLRARLREAEAEARKYASGRASEGPGGRWRLARVAIEVDALRRRLEQVGEPERPGASPEAASRLLADLTVAYRDATRPPLPELAGDEQYARDLAEFRERARAEVDALRAKLPPDVPAATATVPGPDPADPAAPGPPRPPAGGADDVARLIAATMPWPLDPPAGREGGDPARASGSARVRAVAATIKQLQRQLLAPPQGANLALNQTFERLALWSGRLTDAQLDVAEGRDARAAALADGLKRAQDLERLARDLVAGESNGLSEVDIAIAAYARADAEARLRREQARPADPAAPAHPEPTRTGPADAPGRAGGVDAPVTPGPQPTPAAAVAEPQSTIETLKGSPTILMVVSPARDRVTMIDPATQRRSTLRLARPATEVRAIYDDGRVPWLPPFEGYSEEQLVHKNMVEGLIGLRLAGERVEQAALFDRKTMDWFEHPLPRPASEVWAVIGSYHAPLVGFGGNFLEPTRELVAFDAVHRDWLAVPLPRPAAGPIRAAVSLHGTVAFEAGRLLAIYSRAAKKSSFLELDRPPARPGDARPSRFNPELGNFQDGRLIVPDGELIWIYDPGTGDWTKIRTR